MSHYPFDEQKAIIDRESFDAFAQHFRLVEGYDSGHGSGCFVFDKEKLKSLPLSELLELSPFLFAHLHHAFQGPGLEFSTTDLLRLMKERGITSKHFINRFADFEYKVLGEESAQFVSAIAIDLGGEERMYGLQTSSFGTNFLSFRERYYQYSKQLELNNQGRKKPHTLEHVLAFDSAPMAVRYSSMGRLYVLDREGFLHEFEGSEKRQQWKIPLSSYTFPDSGFIDIMSISTLPNITVENDTLFLTTNSYGLQRFDLTDLVESDVTAIIPTQQAVLVSGAQEPSRVEFFAKPAVELCV